MADFTKFVVSSLVSTTSIQITAYKGFAPSVRRSGSEAVFSFVKEPGGKPADLAVLFSDTVLSVRLADFGIPEARNQDDLISFLSDASIGEYLDSGKSLEQKISTEPVCVECFSYQLNEWATRPRSSDPVIRAYMKRKAYAARNFEQYAVSFDQGDLLRLKVSLNRLTQLAEEGEAENLWRPLSMTGGMDALILRPLAAIANVQDEVEFKHSTPPVLTERTEVDSKPETQEPERQTDTAARTRHGRHASLLDCILALIGGVAITFLSLSVAKSLGATISDPTMPDWIQKLVGTAWSWFIGLGVGAAGLLLGRFRGSSGPSAVWYAGTSLLVAASLLLAGFAIKQRTTSPPTLAQRIYRGDPFEVEFTVDLPDVLKGFRVQTHFTHDGRGQYWTNTGQSLHLPDTSGTRTFGCGGTEPATQDRCTNPLDNNVSIWNKVYGFDEQGNLFLNGKQVGRLSIGP